MRLLHVAQAQAIELNNIYVNVSVLDVSQNQIDVSKFSDLSLRELNCPTPVPEEPTDQPGSKAHRDPVHLLWLNLLVLVKLDLSGKINSFGKSVWMLLVTKGFQLFTTIFQRLHSKIPPEVTYVFEGIATHLTGEARSLSIGALNGTAIATSFYYRHPKSKKSISTRRLDTRTSCNGGRD